MYELFIDTSDNKRLMVQVLKDGTVIAEKVETEQTKADRVLLVIDQVLKESGVQLSDLKNIRVNKGPGSFTGVRVGVAIANALAFSLGISVNSKVIGDFETPVY